MNFRYVITFAWFYGYSFLKRGYTYVFSYLVTPLSILFLVYVLSRGELIQYAIVGGLVSVIVTNSVVSLSDVVMLRKEMKLQDMLIATKIGPLEYMLGLATANYIFSSVGVLAYAVLGLIIHVFNVYSVLLSILISLYLNYSMSGLAFVIGTLVPYTRHSWAISGVLGTVLTIIPPIYYPFLELHGIVRYLSLILPSAPASVVSQWITGLSPFNLIATVLFLVEAPLFMIAAMKLSKWRES
ncbi:ABC transporter permease [Metallosphaera hakonensis]|uniref:Daunorubicin ABC transporter ATP-binding protein n=2 Tax=Metallosphaera hakonensis TaxID=79601 RepID=A0A2U9ISQ1_9CREN|nr:ABC transporter permease [Metallosphaera hakonensis]AWR99080.1 ABC transporter permease [Metallosphaera hakonensis JCM 8857 = DSM 7519]